ncbi:MAG TPA: hypothetical protein VGD40_14005 [Chryseosolibacter sp.]
MGLNQLVNATLAQLQTVLSQLSHEEYGRKLPVLSNASVGQHTRHIIEFFQTVIDNYESGVFNYDKRQRNTLLETNRDLAYEELSRIRTGITKEDKDILLKGMYANEVSDELFIRSTYYREIIYNLEHMVHHMAMIKIGIRQSTNVLVPSDFGVASSTIYYKNSIL